MIVDPGMFVRFKRWAPRQGTCPQCGRTFTRRGGNHVYCSAECAARQRYGERICVRCGASFVPKKAGVAYCSRECYLADVRKRN